MFRKQGLFLSSGEGGGGKTPTLLEPLERAGLNQWRTSEILIDVTVTYC
jgi:predicted ATPase